MAAAMANKTVKNRRDVFKRFVHPNRRTRLDSLLPGNKRLFGGKLNDVCKALKDGGQVKKLSKVDPHLISHTMFLSSISPSSSRPQARGEEATVSTRGVTLVTGNLTTDPTGAVGSTEAKATVEKPVMASDPRVLEGKTKMFSKLFTQICFDQGD